MNKERSIAEMIRKGFTRLRSHRYRDALAVGRKLKSLRHSSAFEIMALAHLRLGALPKAISTLEEGVAKAGRVWLLWELLGNCYSDAKRYKAAEAAYQQALLQPKCDSNVIHLNRAIAFERAGTLKNAWSAIQKVDSPRLNRRADEVRIGVMYALGHKRSAAKLALKLCRRRSPVEEMDPRSESSIFTVCARALKDTTATRPKARSLAYRAVLFNNQNAQALALIRELENHRSTNSSSFNLLVRGVWYEPFRKGAKPPGFFRSCQACAPDPHTALRYAKEFFAREVRSSLAIDECTIDPRGKPTLDGVYSLGAFMFYRRKQQSRA